MYKIPAHWDSWAAGVQTPWHIFDVQVLEASLVHGKCNCFPAHQQQRNMVLHDLNLGIIPHLSPSTHALYCRKHFSCRNCDQFDICPEFPVLIMFYYILEKSQQGSCYITPQDRWTPDCNNALLYFLYIGCYMMAITF